MLFVLVVLALAPPGTVAVVLRTVAGVSGVVGVFLLRAIVVVRRSVLVVVLLIVLVRRCEVTLWVDVDLLGFYVRLRL